MHTNEHIENAVTRAVSGNRNELISTFCWANIICTRRNSSWFRGQKWKWRTFGIPKKNHHFEMSSAADDDKSDDDDDVVARPSTDRTSFDHLAKFWFDFGFLSRDFWVLTHPQDLVSWTSRVLGESIVLIRQTLYHLMFVCSNLFSVHQFIYTPIWLHWKKISDFGWLQPELHKNKLD